MYYNADGTMKIIDVICIVRQEKTRRRIEKWKGRQCVYRLDISRKMESQE
ncbi:hypothetical protein COPEUT_00591 [Coprococcus eutactus ATCC 27759]|nr:hypothetical protein COPEUT_00591 [Coprococcus eutactus ATCC 27759]